MKTLLIALRVTLVTLVLTGLVYPLVVTGLAQLLFPDRSNGSFLTDEHGAVAGSELIGQPFSSPAYLASRPSAAGNGWDATSSGGSNLGPTSQKLHDRVADATKVLLAGTHGGIALPGPAPLELVTASASGLDPDLSPEAAYWQAPRIAAARGVSEARVKAVIEDHLQDRDLWVLGEPRVNVLRTNLALDRQFGRPTR